jgi:hypothetical protein
LFTEAEAAVLFTDGDSSNATQFFKQFVFVHSL